MAKLIMDHTFFLQGWSSDQELTIKAIPSLTLLPSIQPFDLVADTQRIVSTELLRSKLAKCWDRLCQRWTSLSSPVHQELLMCTLLTLSSFPRPGGGHTNVFVCTELLRSESELNVREGCDSCDSPSFPDLVSSTSSVTITTRVYSCTHPWACRWCFRRRVIPRFFTQRQIFFPYSPGVFRQHWEEFASENSLGCIFFGWVEMYDDVWLLVDALVHGRSCDTTIVKKVWLKSHLAP